MKYVTVAFNYAIFATANDPEPAALVQSENQAKHMCKFWGPDAHYALVGSTKQGCLYGIHYTKLIPTCDKCGQELKCPN